MVDREDDTTLRDEPLLADEPDRRERSEEGMPTLRDDTPLAMAADEERMDRWLADPDAEYDRPTDDEIAP